MKKNIFYFTGDKPCAINFNYVTHVTLEENVVTINYFTKSSYIESENEIEAKNLYEKLIKFWEYND